MTYADLEVAFSEFPEIERIGRIVLIEILEQTLDKVAALQFRTAKERYRFISESNPEVLQRAPLGHIASYLGITPETLSRIRSKH